MILEISFLDLLYAALLATKYTKSTKSKSTQNTEWLIVVVLSFYMNSPLRMNKFLSIFYY